MSKNLSLLSSKKGWGTALYESLSSCAKAPQTDKKQQLKEIAQDYLMGSANVLGTLSFYDHFKPDHAKKKVFICNGTACMVAGTQSDLKVRLQTHFEDREIGDMCCLGRCHENAAFHYKDANYSGQDSNRLEEILKDTVTLSKDQYGVQSMLERPMLTSDRDFEHYKRLFEVIRTRDPLEMLNEIKYSNLKGRGGAGFPAGQKFETCRAQKGSPKFVVCNADEGDPGSYSDRYLLEQQPHAVLFGMIASAMIVGANFGIVYIRAEYPESVKSMEKAIALWREYFSHQYPEKQQLPVELRIVKGAGSYICGEETALLSSLEGQRPEVRIRPPYPAESGLFLRPTVVNNVETLACIPYILEHGANAFIAFGTDLTAGVKLMSLDGLFNKPGIIEVAFGTPLQQVIYEWGGGFKKPVKALQIGGPLGGIIPVEEIENLSVDYDSFKTLGFDLGHASVVSIPKDFPMIKYLEHLFEFAAHESCGKCFPCRLGTVRGTELLQQAQESSIELELVRDLLTTLKQGSLCGLGTALPLPVENALDYFSEELKPYFNG